MQMSCSVQNSWRSEDSAFIGHHVCVLHNICTTIEMPYFLTQSYKKKDIMIDPMMTDDDQLLATPCKRRHVIYLFPSKAEAGLLCSVNRLIK